MVEQIAQLQKRLHDLETLEQGTAEIFNYKASMSHDESSVQTGNALVRSTASASSAILQMNAYQSPGGASDVFYNSCVLRADSYNFYVLGATTSNSGILQWSYAVNGVSSWTTFISSQDWYSSGTTWNQIKSGTFTLSAGGRINFRGTINGRNGSSSGYYAYLTKFWVEPQTYA